VQTTVAYHDEDSDVRFYRVRAVLMFGATLGG
jgi:hypothetical protein